MQTLLVYDFDWSMIDADSDDAILHGFGLHAYFHHIHPSVIPHWPNAINHIFQCLSTLGHVPQDIEAIWDGLPFHPAMKQAILLAKSRPNVDICVVSDANKMVIEYVLQKEGIRGLVKDIVTNHAEWDKHGRLLVTPWMPIASHVTPGIVPIDPVHGCMRLHPMYPMNKTCPQKICLEHICKGFELSRLCHGKSYDRIVYVGDGLNDLCPVLDLRQHDWVFVRHGRVLDSVLQEMERTLDISGDVLDSASSDQTKVNMELCHGDDMKQGDLGVKLKARKVVWDTADELYEAFKIIFS